MRQPCITAAPPHANDDEHGVVHWAPPPLVCNHISLAWGGAESLKRGKKLQQDAQYTTIGRHWLHDMTRIQINISTQPIDSRCPAVYHPLGSYVTTELLCSGCCRISRARLMDMADVKKRSGSFIILLTDAGPYRDDIKWDNNKP